MKPYRGIPIDKPIKRENFVYGWYSESWAASMGYRSIGSHIRWLDKDQNFQEVEVDPKTVSQQIGRKDKRKKEIYPGDKLKSGKRILIVFWNEDQMQWYVKEEGFVLGSPMCQWAISKHFEIISTIHDEETKDV